jgi:hypothetical protein
MATPGTAVPGTVVSSGSLLNPGGGQGIQGIQGSQGPTVVSTDANNLATLGSDNLILVPASSIWNVRLRSYNAIGNPTFEVDQRNVGTALTNPANGTFIQDRWSIFKSTTLTGTVNTALQSVPSAPIVVPGTNFGITQNFQRFTVGTAQASLAAGDFWGITQYVEGSRWRELAMDVHSPSILVRSSVSGTFALRLRDPTTTHSLVKLCTISTANTWTLIQLPNLPVWVGTYSAAPGGVGYNLDIFWACGSTYLAAVNNAWQTGDIRGVTGMGNFLATAGATFDIAFVQHEPGALCTTPIDWPFDRNLDDTLRYFQKAYDYGTTVGTPGAPGYVSGSISANTNYCIGVPGFLKPLAKVPTVTIWNASTGAANSAYNATTASNISAPSNYVQCSTKIISAVGFSVAQTAGNWIQFFFTADTGW